MIPEPTEIKDILQFLLDQYQTRRMGEAGEESEDSALDQLDEALKTADGSKAQCARMGIKHFLEFARDYLTEHPPQTHVMLHEGFGVQLAGGAVVNITPNRAEQQAPGEMERAPAYPVTEGRSIRGQGGTTDTQSFAVTGAKREPYH